MPRVAHFEICAEDVERAIAFYRHVFGWQVRRWDGPEDLWIVVTGERDAAVEGINGAIRPRRDSVAGSVNLVDVPDLAPALLRIVEAGGVILQPRTSVPGVGYLAYCRDSEGNGFGLIERNPAAA